MVAELGMKLAGSLVADMVAMSENEMVGEMDVTMAIS